MSALVNVIGPVLVAILYIAACSFFREPNRRNFNAIMIAGAGTAYHENRSVRTGQGELENRRHSYMFRPKFVVGF
jgi:hypothetical protein